MTTTSTQSILPELKEYHQALNSYFPKSRLEKQTLTSSELLAHLIFHQRIEEARFAIECAKKYSKSNGNYKQFLKSFEKKDFSHPLFANSDLSKKITSFNLTPLHLAAIFGTTELVQDLIETGKVDCKAQDCHNWTAAHHAAIRTDKSVWKIFQKLNAVSSLKNDNDGTADDLFQMAHLPSFEESTVVAAFYDGKTKVITQAEYRNLANGCSLVDEVYTPPERFVQKWSELAIPESSCIEFEPILRKDYESFIKERTSVVISKDKYGFNLLAGQDIELFNIVAEFTGEDIGSAKDTNDDFLINSIDGDYKNRLRGIAYFARDSFPNTGTVPVENLHGRCRVLLIALRPIKSGEEITYDSADRKVKWNTHHELKPQEMETFFKTHSREDLIKYFIETKRNGYKTTSSSANMLIFSYLFNTPFAMTTLVLKGVINTHFLNTFSDLKRLSILNPFLSVFIQGLEYWEKIKDPLLKEIVSKFILERNSDDQTKVLLPLLMNIPLLEKATEEIEPRSKGDRKEFLFETCNSWMLRQIENHNDFTQFQ